MADGSTIKYKGHTYTYTWNILYIFALADQPITDTNICYESDRIIVTCLVCTDTYHIIIRSIIIWFVLREPIHKMVVHAELMDTSLIRLPQYYFHTFPCICLKAFFTHFPHLCGHFSCLSPVLPAQLYLLRFLLHLLGRGLSSIANYQALQEDTWFLQLPSVINSCIIV